ncbi:DNA-directed DNA polymerase gamma mip1 [Batrachochytrium dendrobatidis]
MSAILSIQSIKSVFGLNNFTAFITYHSRYLTYPKSRLLSCNAANQLDSIDVPSHVDLQDESITNVKNIKKQSSFPENWFYSHQTDHLQASRSSLASDVVESFKEIPAPTSTLTTPKSCNFGNSSYKTNKSILTLPVITRELTPAEIALLEAFDQMVSTRTRLYSKQADDLLDAVLPPVPTKWSQKAGWTCYNPDGTMVPVEHPPTGEPLVFDVEVMYRITDLPAMAIAASPTTWYSWCSNVLQSCSSQDTFDQRISLGDPSIPRLVVGHNIMYDRARISEEYLQHPTMLAYLCTMGLNSSLYRSNIRDTIAWSKMIQGLTDKKYDSAPVPQGYWEYSTNTGKRFVTASSCNSLKHLVELHLSKNMNKTLRDLFEQTKIELVRDSSQFQSAIQYCAQDVLLTHELYKKLFAQFKQEYADPHSVAMQFRLTYDAEIQTLCRQFKSMQSELESQMEQKLEAILEHILLKYNTMENRFNTSISQLDWTLKSHKQLGIKPAWYRSFWDSSKKSMHLSIRKAATAHILELQWDGHPMLYSKEHGWVYRIQSDGNSNTTKVKTGKKLKANTRVQVPDDRSIVSGQEYAYFRVPHPNGTNAQCGTPLSRGYYHAINHDRLTSSSEMGQHYLDLYARCLYWERLGNMSNE